MRVCRQSPENPCGSGTVPVRYVRGVLAKVAVSTLIRSLYRPSLCSLWEELLQVRHLAVIGLFREHIGVHLGTKGLANINRLY